jgi:ankyrin repeat protein
MSIWRAAKAGDIREVERLVGQDPRLLDAMDGNGDDVTPLMIACIEGHVNLVRWLVDNGAAVNKRNQFGETALLEACYRNRLRVVRLLLERGGDPTIASYGGTIPLMAASASLGAPLEVVRVLLDHRSGKVMINHRDVYGRTALHFACSKGRGDVAKALLESGADSSIADDDGQTPMATAKYEISGPTGGGRRECVAVLEVRFSPCPPYAPCCSVLITW